VKYEADMEQAASGTQQENECVGSRNLCRMQGETELGLLQHVHTDMVQLHEEINKLAGMLSTTFAHAKWPSYIHCLHIIMPLLMPKTPTV
jgi:hypothetical protein